MAARVNIVITETVASLNACSVFRITTETTEMATNDPTREAGAIIQGISLANVTIDCIEITPLFGRIPVKLLSNRQLVFPIRSLMQPYEQNSPTMNSSSNCAKGPVFKNT